MLEDLLINGATTGAVYALLALGFTLIYGVAKILNLSHGAFYMLGAYIFYASLDFLQLETFPALILAVIFVAFIGAIVYGLLIRPIIESELNVMVVTLGAAMVFQYMVILLFGSTHKTVPYLIPQLPLVEILGVSVRTQKIVALAVSLSLIVVLWIFISKSKIGGAMRAMAQDREVATLMGINTERLFVLTLVISASLAAIAGVLVTPLSVASPDMWMFPLIISFSVVILGGLGSIKGSLVGAFILAYSEESVVFLAQGEEHLRGAFSLLIMVLVLLLRPSGLFGKRVEME